MISDVSRPTRRSTGQQFRCAPLLPVSFGIRFQHANQCHLTSVALGIQFSYARQDDGYLSGVDQ